MHEGMLRQGQVKRGSRNKEGTREKAAAQVESKIVSKLRAQGYCSLEIPSKIFCTNAVEVSDPICA
jgi:hypothetical protein